MPAATPRHLQQKMIAAYLGGASMAAAAASCGLSEKACFSALKRNGVPCRAVHAPVVATTPRIAPEEVEPDLSHRIAPARGHTPRAGFVYLLASRGEHKIGFSAEPDGRRDDLAKELARPLHPLWSFAHAAAGRLESALHHHFRARRVRKEWFALRAADVRWLESLDAASADALVAGYATRKERQRTNAQAIRERSQLRVIPAPLDCRAKNLAGLPFGRLTVLRYAGRVVYGDRPHGKGNRAAWLCRCACGTEKVVVGDSLRKGATVSCGCLMAERAARKLYRHGQSRTPEYVIWQNIKRRCLPVERGGHPRYGGRGIRVCERWRDSFAAFLTDVGPRPSADHSVERRDGDGPYCPENCCWATRDEQNRNKQTTHRISFEAQTLCLTDWAKRIGIHPASLYYRLTKYNWGVREALTTPKGRRPVTV